MASKSENRRINLFINGKEVKNDIKSISNEYQKAIKDLSRMTIGSKEYIEQAKEVRKLKDILTEHNRNIGRIQGAWQTFKTNLGGWIATGFGLASAGQIFRSFFSNVKGFESAASELSALTGLMGEDLKFLRSQALGLSSELKDSGILIGQSATDILTAFKVVGSAKPELLKNKEGLVEVTKQAIILSEAAKMELEPAVQALTLIMNQFGAPASQAAKYINVLAAGSKEGAAEITDLAESVKEFGTVANLANINVEESVALVEALAEKGLKGSRAGTGIRNVLLELMKGSDETNPKIVGLNTALENLAKQNLSSAEMTKLFGKENVVTASILVETRGRVDELNAALSNTNTAYEQASINTNNLQGSIDNLKSGWANFLISLNEGSGWMSKTFRVVVDILSEAVDEWRRWAMSDDEKAYEKKMNASLEFIEKFKQHNKLGQEDIEAEWNERLQGELFAFKNFGEYYTAEQIKQHNEELQRIYEHINLIKQAKAELETSTIPPLPGVITGADTSGSTTGEEDASEFTEREMQTIERLQALADIEFEITDNKLTAIEQRESDHVSVVAQKHAWLTDEKLREINAYSQAAMQITQAMVNRNNAQMNRELQAAGDNEAAKDAIRKKYAEKNKKIAIAQARISGALAILNIWKGEITSNPVLDSIIKGLLTAAQIILTESQISEIQSATFAKGGFTGGAEVYVAGEKGQEWIAPNWMAQHPYIGPVIQDLEKIRTGSAPETIFRNPIQFETSDTTDRFVSTTGSLSDQQLAKMIQQNERIIEYNETLVSFFKDPQNRRAIILYDDLQRSNKEIDEMNSLKNF